MTFKILDPNFVLWLWNRIKTMVKNYVTTYVSNNALASTTKYAASKDVGGAAELTVGIPFGKLDETSTSTVMTATVPGITELKSGVCMFLMNGRVTSASGYTININGLGAKPVYGTMAAATRSTTLFNVAYTGFFVFNEERVEGGCWDFYYGYDSNSDTIAYDITEIYSCMKRPKAALYRYQIVFTCDDGMVLPANSISNNINMNKELTTQSFNIFKEIYFYASTTTVSANANIAGSVLYLQYTNNLIDLRYSFNTGKTLVPSNEIYLVCVPQADGSVKLHSNPIVMSLPDHEDGLLYKRIGRAYDDYRINLELHKPVYYFKDGAIRLWTNQPAIEKSITDTLGAGTALDLQDNEGTETTFFKRLSGGSNNVPSGLATIRGMKGKTVKWNQMINRKEEIIHSGNLTGVSLSCGRSIPKGHLTFLSCEIKVSENTEFKATNFPNLTLSQGGNTYGNSISTYMGTKVPKDNKFHFFKGLARSASDLNAHVYVYSGINSGTVTWRNINCIDLTLIFGEGNEPETVEEFEAWLAENVGLQDYYEYSEPTMLSADANSLETVGFNQWDEEWELGTFNFTTGEKKGSTTKIRTKNYIPVFPNTNYTFTNTLYPTTEWADLLFYDENKNYIANSSSWNYIGRNSKNVYCTPTNAKYMMIDFYTKYGTSYKHNICVNLSRSGIRNGEYEEYWKRTYPINVKQLTSNGTVIFPNGLNRVGDAYDEIVCKNGVYKAIKRIGCVDLGTLTWERISSTSYGDMTDWFRVKSFVNTYHAIAKNDEIHHITGEYVSAPTKAFISRILADKEIMLYTDNILYVRDDSYTTAADFKTAMSGVLLFYELATPQEFTLYNFPCNFKVDKWGTEEMVCEGTALRPYITLSYGLNAVEKLKNFPLPPISCRVVNKALVVDNAEPYLAMGYKPMVFRWMRRGGRRNNPNYGNAGAKKYIRFRRLKRGWIPYYPGFYRVKDRMEENPLASLAYDDKNGFYKLMVFDYKDWLDSDYNENPLYLVNIIYNNRRINVGWGNDPKALATRSTANARWSYQPNVYMKFGLGFVKSFPDSKDDILSSELLVSNIAKFGVVFFNDGSDEHDENCWVWSL